MYYCFNNVWRVNIISCVIRSPADHRVYMAEWENGPLNPRTKKKKKQRVNLEPPRPMAARLKSHQHCKSPCPPLLGVFIDRLQFVDDPNSLRLRGAMQDLIE